MGFSILFISSAVGAFAALIAILFAGYGPMAGLGVYTFVGTWLLIGWIVALAYHDRYEY